MYIVKSSKYFDYFVASFSLVCFFAALWLLFNDKLLHKISNYKPKLTQVVGEVLTTSNNIQNKISSENNWLKIAPHENILDRGLIFSGAQSGAEFVFQDQTHLMMNEKTLISIRKKTSYYTLEIFEGSITISIPKGRAWKIISGDSERIIIGKSPTTTMTFQTQIEEPQLAPITSMAFIHATSHRLTLKEIEDVVLERKRAIKQCYTNHLEVSPYAEGRFMILLEVLPSGIIDRIRVTQSSIDDEIFQTCVANTFQNVSFRPFGGGPINAVYPMRFR